MSGNEQEIQTFEKTNVTGATALPLVTGFVGLGCAAAAIGTAVVPASFGGVNQIVGVLERLGLDKGPLALFGFGLCALAATMWRAGNAIASARASEEASLIGQQILGDLGAQSAAVASLRAELGAARAELAEVRQGAGAPSVDGGNAASSPMFRMAASLDQLGAHVSTRIDSTRAEFLEAIEGLTARVDRLNETGGASATEQVAAEQRALIDALREAQADAATNAERAAAESRERFDSVRGELAELIETVADLAGPAGLPATEPTRWNEELPPADDPGATEKFEDAAPGVFEVEALAAEGLAPIAPPAPFSPPFQTSEEALRPAAASPVPPPELADEPLEDVVHAAAPILEQDGRPAELTGEPFESGVAAAAESTFEPDRVEAVEPTGPPLSFGTALPEVTPTCGEEPPAPLPAPSEGLELLDEMQEDRARPADLTPPLFPELGPDPGNS